MGVRMGWVGDGGTFWTVLERFSKVLGCLSNHFIPVSGRT